MLSHLALLAACLAPQSPPDLIADLDAFAGPPFPSVQSSNAAPLLGYLGGLLLRAQLPGQSQPTLWWTDATGGGPIPLSGVDQGDPILALELPGLRTVVLVDSASEGRELLGFDAGGAAPGAELLTVQAPGPDDGVLAAPVPWRGRAWYADQNAGLELELWSTDATPAGTTLEETLQTASQGSEATLWTADDRLFVSTPQGLFAIDDPGAAPRLLTAVAGTSFGSPVQTAIEFSGELWFSAFEPATGQEWWRTDGTVAGTQLAFELAPGPAGSFPQPLAADAQRLWFMGTAPGVGRELHTVDSSGTPQLVVDLAPGPESNSGSFGALLDDGRLVFGGGASTTQLEPYVSDGTAAGTQPLGDLAPGLPGSDPRRFTPWAGRLVFNCFSGAARGVWSTDGTPAGTVQLSELPAIDAFEGPTFAPALGELWYAVQDPTAGRELWSTDATPTGTDLGLNLAPEAVSGDSAPEDLVRLGDRLAFSVDIPGIGRELAATDGTSEGTELVKNLLAGAGSGDPRSFCALGQRLLFTAESLDGGREPWATDGTTAGTVQLADLVPGTGSSVPSAFLPMNGYALFTASLPPVGGGPLTRALMRTDGTPAGTTVVTTEPLSIGFPFEQRAGRLGDLLLFEAGTPQDGRELWVSDGTALGTGLLVDLAPGPDDSNPSEFARLGDRLLFRAATPALGLELYATDGTAAGTSLVADLEPGVGGSAPSGFVELDGALLFAAATAASNPGLWRTDGTLAGTVLVSALEPDSSAIANLARVGERALFITLTNGIGQPRRLWSTDGTTAGTQEVPLPVQAGFEPDQLHPALPIGDRGDGVVLGSTPSTGSELWLVPADGGALALLPEVAAGPPSSAPSDAIEFKGRLFFSADDPVFGRELHALELADFGLGGAEPFGQGCSGSGFEPTIGWAGSAGLGQLLELQLDDAAPGALSLALVSGEFAFLPLPANCLTYLAAPTLLGSTVADGSGAATLPVPIPDVPALLGAAYFLQWISAEPGGPLLGAFAASDALELVLGP